MMGGEAPASTQLLYRGAATERDEPASEKYNCRSLKSAALPSQAGDAPFHRTLEIVSRLIRAYIDLLIATLRACARKRCLLPSWPRSVTMRWRMICHANDCVCVIVGLPVRIEERERNGVTNGFLSESHGKSVCVHEIVWNAFGSQNQKVINNSVRCNKCIL